MIVSINQPAYLPWLAYFHRIAVSDVHVVLDHVQFEKNSFINRNRIRTASGSVWMTIPVHTSGRFGDLSIDTIEVDETKPWRRKSWQTMRQAYARARHFDEYAPFFEAVYGRPWERLIDVCDTVTAYLLKSFAIDTPLVRSSELTARQAKDELVLGLCLELGATTYLSGTLGRNYLREELFREAGIKVVYQDYRHPIYAQLWEPFEPAMAAVDLLFNYGLASRAIILGDEQEAPA